MQRQTKMSDEALFPHCKSHQTRLEKLEDAFQQIALTAARIEERLVSVDNKIDCLSVKVENNHEKTDEVILKAKETELKLADIQEARKVEKEKQDNLSKVLWGIGSSIVVAIILTLLRLK